MKVQVKEWHIYCLLLNVLTISMYGMELVKQYNRDTGLLPISDPAKLVVNNDIVGWIEEVCERCQNKPCTCRTESQVYDARLLCRTDGAKHINK